MVKRFMESNLTIKSNRIVEAVDAIEWLNQRITLGDLKEGSFVASMPDISEFPAWSLENWKKWFTDTAELVLRATPESGVSIFYQSDIKYEGTWVDKAYLVQKAAEKVGSDLLWHKVVCRVKPGYTTFGRPAYSHILAFSKTVRLKELSLSTADVIPDLGDKTWERGMGLPTCLMLANFVKNQTPSQTLYHPFCGEGAMLAAANSVGLNAFGIERSPKRAAKALRLQIDEKQTKWIS